MPNWPWHYYEEKAITKHKNQVQCHLMSSEYLFRFFLHPSIYITLISLSRDAGTFGVFSETTEGHGECTFDCTKITERQWEHKGSYCIRPLRSTPCFHWWNLVFPLCGWEEALSCSSPQRSSENREHPEVVKVLSKFHCPVIVNIWLPLNTIQKLSVILSPILMEG